MRHAPHLARPPPPPSQAQQQQQQGQGYPAQGGYRAPFPGAYGIYYGPAAFAAGGQTRQELLEAVRRQVEFYFSPENLEGTATGKPDLFLRSKMEAEGGWVPVMVIASFRRVQMLTPDPTVLLEALTASTTVETSPDGLSMRCANGAWAKYVKAAAADKAEPSGGSVPPPPPSSSSSVPLSTPAGAPRPSVGEDLDEADMFEMDGHEGKEDEEGAGAKGARDDNTISDADLSRLTVVTPSRRPHQGPPRPAAPAAPGSSGPKSAITPDMAQVINDGLAFYEREVVLADKDPRPAAAPGTPAPPLGSSPASAAKPPSGSKSMLSAALAGSPSAAAISHGSGTPPKSGAKPPTPSGRRPSSREGPSAPRPIGSLGKDSHFYPASLPKSSNLGQSITRSTMMGQSPPVGRGGAVGWFFGAKSPADSAHPALGASPSNRKSLLGAPCPALPRPALPRPALPCPALPRPALPCPALPCPALPRPALPRPALPCPALPCRCRPDPARLLPQAQARPQAAWSVRSTCPSSSTPLTACSRTTGSSRSSTKSGSSAASRSGPPRAPATRRR